MPGASGVVAPGSQALDLGTHRLGGFGSVHPGNWAADQGAHPPRISSVGAQATDRGSHRPGGFAPVHPGSLTTDLGAHRPGLQVCAVAAYQVFTVQGLREWELKRPRLWWRIL